MYIRIASYRPVTRQQIPNTYQWTTLEAVFSMRTVRNLRDAAIEELLEAVFSVWSAQRLYHAMDRVHFN
jgi:hypothetical protein